VAPLNLGLGGQARIRQHVIFKALTTQDRMKKMSASLLRNEKQSTMNVQARNVLSSGTESLRVKQARFGQDHLHRTHLSSESDLADEPSIPECHSSPMLERRKMDVSLRQWEGTALQFEGGMASALVTTPRRTARMFSNGDASEEKFESKAPLEPLTPHRLAIRQKQIDYGKNTVGYDEYLLRVPKEKRSFRDPQTPDIHSVCSRRSWDGQIKKWRRLLHAYDPAPLVHSGGDFEEATKTQLMRDVLDLDGSTSDDGPLLEDTSDQRQQCNLFEKDDPISPFLDTTTSWASFEISPGRR
jgi:hypothetical protein